jgi:signal transduction histidine kinase
MASGGRISSDALAALNQAALAVAGNLSLDKTLHEIVEAARQLVGARYAALGVPDGSGRLARFIHVGMAPDVTASIDHLPHGLGLLGVILREGRTIRIPRISEDPRSVGFPPGHPPMEAFLGVPIKAGNEILGNLYLTEKLDGTEFTRSDEDVIELLAAHAAIAITNARLYEQVGRTAIVEERSRIGMDLHDGVIQAIYAVGLTLESVRLLLQEEEQEEPVVLIDGAIAGLNDAIRDIRNFILDLRPRRFEGNLSEGLARLAREFQANTMVPVELDAPAEAIATVPQPVARALFFTAQEALANVARHARASRVEIRAERRDHAVILSVVDDGVGFDVHSRIQSTGHGLANMRARAEERNGQFEVASRLGKGTTIRMRLPV